MKNRRIGLVFLTLAIALLTACASSKDFSQEEMGEITSDGAETEEYDEPEIYSGIYMYDSDKEYMHEQYVVIDENQEKAVKNESLVTLSLKVDTAAYNNVQRYLEQGEIPPKDAVKTEEMINYFSYDGKMKFEEHPLAVYTEVGKHPFDEEKYLAMIRVKSEDIDAELLPPSNLTFLIDTSGSMDSHDKLPLLKEAFELLVETLDEEDRVSIVTYAGSSQVVLESAKGNEHDKIMQAISQLRANGSTAGADGINTAYELAQENFITDGNNRIILATDGDFNVGISTLSGLEELVSEKRDSGIYLSILGFGTGNLRDDVMETLAKHGNGNHSYINNVSAAKKVLMEELSSNLFVIAEDVKGQVEFNPENVESFKLVGYENRIMDNQDFDNDKKDAGEIGVGTDVVVLFELKLKQEYMQMSTLPYGDELFEVRLRYKNPGETESRLLSQPVTFSDIAKKTSDDFNFAASVMAFSEVLRAPESSNINVPSILHLAEESLSEDTKGYRKEFLDLVESYQEIAHSGINLKYFHET